MQWTGRMNPFMHAALLLYGALTILTGCQKDPVEIVATADNLVILSSEFSDKYRSWLLTTGVQDTSRRRHAFVGDMAATRLAVLQARREGIEKAPHYQTRRITVERRILIDLFIEKMVLDSVAVDEAQVRELYTRAQSTVNARQLYARTYAQAESLRGRLQGGESFQMLAEEVFQDPELQASGGRLPPFTFDEMDPDVEDVAFTIPVGEISHPVRTPQGYFLIQVEDRFTRPIITETEFQEKRHLFEAYALERARSRIRRHYVRELVEDARISFLEPTLLQLFERITPGSPIQEDVLDPSILVYFGTPQEFWTVEEFRSRARFATDRQRAQVRSIADLRDFTQGLIASELMLREAMPLRLTPAYEQRLEDAMDQYIVQYLHQLDFPEISEEDARAYYESASPQEFRQTARIELTWQIFSTETAARAVDKLSDPSGPALFEAGMLGEISEDLFRAEEGALVGPYPISDDWIHFHTGPQFPPKKRTFEEARDFVNSVLREEKLRENRLARYAELASKYSLVIHEEVLYALALGAGK